MPLITPSACFGSARSVPLVTARTKHDVHRELSSHSSAANVLLINHTRRVQTPPKAGLRDARELLRCRGATRGLTVIYRLDEETIAAEYQDRAAAIESGQMLLGSSLCGTEVTLELSGWSFAGGDICASRVA